MASIFDEHPFPGDQLPVGSNPGGVDYNGATQGGPGTGSVSSAFPSLGRVTTEPVGPPRGGTDPNSLTGAFAGGATANPMDRGYIIQQLTNILQQHGIQPGPRGSGPGDVEYYADQIAKTGGWQGGNANWWTDRLASDIQGGGRQGGGQGGGYNLYSPNDLTAGFTAGFQAPTAEQARATPGYQFARDAGLNAIDSGAAARGTLLTYGNQRDRAQFATGLADQTYSQSYDRALSEYMNAFSIFNTNQSNLFNRNYALSGQGLSAAGGQAGAAEGIGKAQGTAYENIGNAQGAGAISRGNNWADTATTLGDLGTLALRRAA
jgi:hypothetical protein